jgi:hypothetical protein
MAALDLQVNAIDGGKPPELLGQVFCLQDDVGHLVSY